MPYGNHNLKQITANLPKANYGHMKRNSSMPGFDLQKREQIPLRELREERLSHRGSSRAGANDQIPTNRTPGNRYNDKLLLKKVVPPIGLPPIDQKHLNLRRGGEQIIQS